MLHGLHVDRDLVEASQYRKQRGLNLNRTHCKYTYAQNSDKMIYTNLSSAKSIRLLTILPGQHGDVIQSTLEVVNLESVPSYEALSYAWGNSQPPTELMCNKQWLKITPNLSAAIQRMRYGHKSRTVWIDAVCINQRDLNERSQQVLIMGAIYRQARNVVVWLGEDDGTASISIPIIQKVAGYCREEIGDKSMFFKHIIHEPRDSKAKHERDLPPLEHQDWSAVLALYEREWFRRVWVIQEVARGKTAVMMIDHFTVAWLDVTMTSSWLVRKMYCVTLDQINPLLQATKIYTMSLGYRNLLTLLDFSSQCEATDPRDRVFALLGLLTGAVDLSPNSLLRPNYNKSVVEVYTDVVRHLISEPKKPPTVGSEDWEDGDIAALDVLSKNDFLENENENSEGYEFPSWVPRWDRSIPGGRNWSRANFGPKWTASAEFPVSVCKLNSPKSLGLRGIVITLVAVVDDCLYNAWDPPDKDENSPVGRLLNGTIRVLADYAGPDTLKEAFARTITAGNTKEQFYSTESSQLCHESDLDAYLQDGIQCQDGRQFKNAIRYKQTFFITGNRHIGMGHRQMKEGDHVCVLFGGSVLYIIRPVEDYFTFVGECYVHGFMDGKAIELWKSGQLVDQCIDLR